MYSAGKDLAESVKEWRLKLRLKAKEQKVVSRTKLPCQNDFCRAGGSSLCLLRIDKLVAVAVAGGREKSEVGSTQFLPRE